MFDVFIWLVIILLFILSFVGIIYPLIPSPLVLWIGFLLYHFAINAQNLTFLFWIVVVVLTLVLVISDIIANSFFVKKFGGSMWGEHSAGIAIVIGSFIAPPFGILIVPFITVFLVEIIQKRTFQEASLASIGSLIGFLGGAFAKFTILFIMIIWFIVAII